MRWVCYWRRIFAASEELIKLLPIIEDLVDVICCVHLGLCTLDVVRVGIVIHKLGGVAAAGMASGGVAGCMAAAGCSGQRGRGDAGQQRAAAAVGGDESPEVGDRSIPVVEASEELIIKHLLPLIGHVADVGAEVLHDRGWSVARKIDPVSEYQV